MIGESDISIWTDPRAWSALVALCTALWAIFSNTREWSRNRLLKGIEIVDKFADKFDSKEYRLARSNAADWLLNPARDINYPAEPLMKVLGLFESLSYMHKKGVVETETVWHYFSSWIIPYVYMASEEIKNINNEDKTCFEDLKDLHDQLIIMERTKYGEQHRTYIMSKKAHQEFLNSEKNLT